jgi:hypothetical protein
MSLCWEAPLKRFFWGRGFYGIAIPSCQYWNKSKAV